VAFVICGAIGCNRSSGARGRSRGAEVIERREKDEGSERCRKMMDDESKAEAMKDNWNITYRLREDPDIRKPQRTKAENISGVATREIANANLNLNPNQDLRIVLTSPVSNLVDCK
jgi:hypothetical protein